MKEIPQIGSVSAKPSQIQLGLVTVVIPLYNRREYIADALNSAWTQTYRPIEIIIVDDGSTDDSADIARAWIDCHEKDSKFERRLFCQLNRGSCAARNAGLSSARGEYIQWLDDDDVMYPNKLEMQVAYLKKHPKVDVIACQVDYLDTELNFVTRSDLESPRPDEKMHHYLMRQDIIGFAPLYRRSVLKRVGGWSEGLPCGQDNDLNVRLALLGARFALIDHILAGVRMHKKNRLCHNVRFSRNLLRNDYDKNLFLAFVAEASLLDKDDDSFRKLVAKRLLADARVYFSRAMPGRARSCLHGAFEVKSDQLSRWDRFCLMKHSFLIATPTAFAAKLLHALKRRVALRLLQWGL